MAQYARRGIKRHSGRTWADGLCLLRVEDGAVAAYQYEPGNTLCKTADAAVALLRTGADVTAPYDLTLLDEVRAQWAAQFNEPALRPDMAAALDEVLIQEG